VAGGGVVSAKEARVERRGWRERREGTTPSARALSCSARLRAALALSLCDAVSADARPVGSGWRQVVSGALKYAAGAIHPPTRRRGKLWCGSGTTSQDRRIQPKPGPHVRPSVGRSVDRNGFGTFEGTAVQESG